MSTPATPAYRNAHEQIIPYLVFKALDWSVVLTTLLPKGKTGHGRH